MDQDRLSDEAISWCLSGRHVARPNVNGGIASPAARNDKGKTRHRKTRGTILFRYAERIKSENSV